MRLVYDYRSYRAFLKDYYLEQKERSPSFSYSVFAKQLGLASAAHVQLILTGKRNLTVHNIHRVADALGFPRAELEYFEALVHENQAEGESEKRFYANRLKDLGGHKPKSSARVKVSYLLSHGLLPAFLLQVEGRDLLAAERAGEQFGVGSAETRGLLEQLLKEGVIELGQAAEGARIRLSQRHLIIHDKKAKSQAQKAFLSRQLRLSVRAFESMYDQEAKFYAHTFSIAEGRLHRYLDEVKALLEKVTELSDDEAGETVMQLNIQLFPYVKKLL